MSAVTLPGDLATEAAGLIRAEVWRWLFGGAPERPILHTIDWWPFLWTRDCDPCTGAPGETDPKTPFCATCQNHGRIPVLPLTPAGTDIAARWLARHHGFTVGGTAPTWELVSFGVDGATWRLSVVGWEFGVEDQEVDIELPRDLLTVAPSLHFACLHAAGSLP